jgi:hypothetical protein
MFNPFKKKPFEIDDFAKLVMTEAKKAGIAESLEYDPKSLVLKRGDQRMNLVNLFNDYTQANAEHKERLLGNALALLREKKEDISLEEAKSKVVALLSRKPCVLPLMSSYHPSTPATKESPVTRHLATVPGIIDREEFLFSAVLMLVDWLVGSLEPQRKRRGFGSCRSFFHVVNCTSRAKSHCRRSITAPS